MKRALAACFVLFTCGHASAAEIIGDGIPYPTVQMAIDGIREGGEIRLAPGTYREKLRIDKTGVQLRGTGSTPGQVVLVWSDANATVGGTVKSASLTVSGNDFRASNLTIQNDYQLHAEKTSQAVALAVTGDRAVFDRVRLLGAQDTLYAATKKCDQEPCPVSRQYFRDCYIEGHVDFIFGDAKAFFERCEIRAIAHDEIMLTAHSRTDPAHDKAYVFDHCRITADPGAKTIYLGRPWRDHARVVFMNTGMDAQVHPEGWREWTPGTTNRLSTAWYAEYQPRGKYNDVSRREPRSHQLTSAQAREWSKKNFLAGSDGWRP